MKVVVHDASILIDLALSKTVEAWFAGGIETWTTDLIYPAEIGLPEQRVLFDAYASAGKLKIRKIGPVEIEVLVRTRARLGLGLSLADVSSLTLAKTFGEGAVLATGDRMLRKTAEKERIRACGILGLFDVMVGGAGATAPVLPYSVAIEKLRDLMQMPECRLPPEKCNAKLKLWSQNRTK